LDVNGKPIVGTMVLEEGTQVDRFGSERGTFVSAADAPKFFDEHGFFYQTNPEIGSLVEDLDDNGLADGSEGLQSFTSTLLHDERLKRILETYDERAKLWFSLGCDPGHYFASTIDPSQENRLVIYMWSPGTELEFCDCSHMGESKGVRAANGMVEVPVAFLRRKGIKFIRVRMEKGGVALVHPRHAFQSISGFSRAYAIGKTAEKNLSCENSMTS